MRYIISVDDASLGALVNLKKYCKVRLIRLGALVRLFILTKISRNIIIHN